jgi:hypothetical protein
VLGYHRPAEDARTADALRYYRALEARSPRVKVLPIGKTDEGREMVIVFIANEDTITRLEEYRGYLAKIADPRGTSDAEMKAIIAKAKPIYHFSAGLHSAETGPPEMVVELAYRLAAGESDLIRKIRDNVIVSITPAADPDGRDRYVDWYYQHMIDIDKESDRITGPPYWGKYIYHDNNRDINYSQVSMKNALDWYLSWHPPIWHDLHESVPFLYTFSGQAPQNPTLDPIVYGEMPWFANFEMAQMIKYGMPGVWTHAFVDMWSPGYLAFAASNHNGLIRMYETFGNGGATTMKRTVANPEFPGAANQTTREWYRPLPPHKEVVWSMRNNTNYMQTGVLTALQLASSFPQVILENYYQKTINAIASGEKDAPHGFVIPAGQKDRSRVALLVNLLRVQGIEVGQATGELKLADGTYPAGSYVVKRNQPYGRLAKILLEKQDFPDANLRTYDDTGWTMGLMLHAEVKATTDKAVLSARRRRSHGHRDRHGGTAGGKAAAYVIPNTGSNSMVTLRFRLGFLRQGQRRGVQDRRPRDPGGIVHRLGDAAGKAADTDGHGWHARPHEGHRDARARRHRGRGDADGRDARRRCAARGDLFDLGQYAGSRMGAPRLRPVRDAVRPHLQGTREEGQPPRELRRDRHPEPGPHRQGPGLRRRVEGQAAALQEGPSTRRWGRTASLTTSRVAWASTVSELQKFVNDGGVLVTLATAAHARRFGSPAT